MQPGTVAGGGGGFEPGWIGDGDAPGCPLVETGSDHQAATLEGIESEYCFFKGDRRRLQPQVVEIDFVIRRRLAQVEIDPSYILGVNVVRQTRYRNLAGTPSIRFDRNDADGPAAVTIVDAQFQVDDPRVASSSFEAQDGIEAPVAGAELPVTMLIDPNMKFTNELGASVTPQAYLFTADGNLKYSGKIDNWVNALGKKKLEVTETYLKDAILASLDGKEVQPEQTEPIGCLIE